MGERRAIGGYHPQYRVAGTLVIRALRNGMLEWIRVADPEAVTCRLSSDQSLLENGPHRFG